MQLLLLIFCTLSVFLLSYAEPRLRISSAEDAFYRRAQDLMRRKGRSWEVPSRSPGFSNFAEKRRVRELFGKRSTPIVMSEDEEEIPDDQYQSIYDVMAQLHRDRRGRVRELFG